MRNHLCILLVEFGYMPGASWREWRWIDLRPAKAWGFRAGRLYFGIYRRRELIP